LMFAEAVEKGLARGLSWEQATDAAGEAFGIALEETSPRVADSLQRTGPRMLRRQRRSQRGFERRLRQRWGQALDLMETIYVCAEEAGSNFNRERRPDAASSNDVRFDVLTRLHARACRTTRETLHLLSGGYPMGALARCRTLHELAVTAMVLAEHGTADGSSDLAERFVLSERVSAYKDAVQFQEHAASLGYEPFSETEMEDMRAERDLLLGRFGKEYGDTYGWAAVLFNGRPPKFSELESLAEVAHLRPHYRWASHEVHSDAKGLEANTLTRGNVQWQSTGATNAGLADPGHMALISLHQCTVALLLSPEDPTPKDLVALMAIQALVDRAGDAFLAAHHRLESDEAEASQPDSAEADPDSTRSCSSAADQDRSDAPRSTAIPGVSSSSSGRQSPDHDLRQRFDP
jgi:hypothetical protein